MIILLSNTEAKSIEEKFLHVEFLVIYKDSLKKFINIFTFYLFLNPKKYLWHNFCIFFDVLLSFIFYNLYLLGIF